MVWHWCCFLLASNTRQEQPWIVYAISHTYLLTYLLTPWSRGLLAKLTGLQLVKKFPAFYGTWRCITTVTSASLWLFCNMISFYGEELLAPRPTPKLEDHPLSALCDCLFNIFTATLHIGGCSFICNLRMRHAMVIRTHVSQMPHHIKPKIIKYCQCQIALNKTLSHKFEMQCKVSSNVKAKSYKKNRIQRDLPVYFEASTLTVLTADFSAIISLCCKHSSWQQWFTVVNIICCCCDWLAASNCWLYTSGIEVTLAGRRWPTIPSEDQVTFTVS